MDSDKIDFDNIDHGNPFADRLIAAKQAVDDIERVQDAFDSATMPGTFVTGGSGVSARRHRALDRQIERTVSLAHRAVKARGDLTLLERMYIAWQDGRIDWQERSIRKRVTKVKKPAMTTEEALFIGNYPAGIVYANRARDVGGDYQRCGFLSYGTLELDIEDDCPARLRPLIKAHASDLQARDGESYQVSAVGQTVELGCMKKGIEAQKRMDIQLAAAQERRLAGAVKRGAYV